MTNLFLIPYVRSVWQRLCWQLTNQQRMCIFGAGQHTEWLLSVTDDLPQPPIEYIVDDHPTTDHIAGIPVITPDAIDPRAHRLVLLSSDGREDELAERANLIWPTDTTIVRLYDELPPGPFDKTDPRARAMSAVASRRTRQSPPSHSVAIVADKPRAREAKLAAAIRAAGWSIELFHRDRPDFDPAVFFDHVHTYQHVWDALRSVSESDADLAHLTVCTDYRTAHAFVQHRPLPVVIDSYDMISGMYTDEFFQANPTYRNEAKRELECITRADALCCRSQEAERIAETQRIQLPPVHPFPDGCWNRTPTEKPINDTDPHLVFVGNVDTLEDANPFSINWGILWLANALADQRVHLHVYPSTRPTAQPFDQPFAKYRDLTASQPFFHLHQPVPADSLIDEIARYHAGIFVYREVADPVPSLPIFTHDKLFTCASNKFFDFLDAHLPIIHNAERGSLLDRIAGTHGADLNLRDVPLDQWGDAIRNADMIDLRRRAEAAKRAYDVRSQGSDLVAFYESTIDRAHQRVAQTEEPANGHNASSRRPAVV
jgi:hypothetical protein